MWPWRMLSGDINRIKLIAEDLGVSPKGLQKLAEDTGSATNDELCSAMGECKAQFKSGVLAAEKDALTKLKGSDGEWSAMFEEAPVIPKAVSTMSARILPLNPYTGEVGANALDSMRLHNKMHWDSITPTEATPGNGCVPAPFDGKWTPPGELGNVLPNPEPRTPFVASCMSFLQGPLNKGKGCPTSIARMRKEDVGDDEDNDEDDGAVTSICSSDELEDVIVEQARIITELRREVRMLKEKCARRPLK